MTPDLSCNNLPAMLDCGTIPVWVTEVRYTGGAVAYGRGETDDGEAVHFAAEPRALYAIAGAPVRP